MKNYFDDRVVVITGSSMGIGKSLALLLGSKKAKMVLNARNAPKLNETVEELKKMGYNCIGVAGDVTLEEDCRNLINTTLQHFGRMDVLVNNAGTGMRGMISKLTPQAISTIYKINAISPMMLSQMALQHIKDTKGSIVFISSLAGLRGLPFLSVYSAAKMSLTAFAQAMRVENYADKIHIGLVFVGITQIEKGKAAVGADGLPVMLEPRTGALISTIEQVAVKIAGNISSRKKQTIIGIPGKLFFLLTRYLPSLFEFLLLRSQKRVNKLYK